VQVPLGNCSSKTANVTYGSKADIKAEGVGDAGPDKLVATYLDLGVNCLTFDVDQGRDRALL
jgi:hypothetical protein